MQDPDEAVDRVAMIEAASRGLRQQLQRGGGARDRPRSNGSQHDAAMVGTSPWPAESSQRRNRSAEHQHRTVRERCRQQTFEILADGDVESDEDPLASSCPGLEELKRPTTRKKDPSASAVLGLGQFSGPARMQDAFEAKKTRQPIPVQSWGPRPPSRGGPSRGSTQIGGSDEAKHILGQPRGRGSCGASSSCSRQSGRPPTAAEVGGTWAAARGEARVTNETRRGRDRRSSATRGMPEGICGADLGGLLFDGSGGSQALHQQLHQQILHQPVAQQSGLEYAGAPWQAEEGAFAAAEAGCGSPWPGGTFPTSPGPESSGNSATRQRPRQMDGVSVEDFDADPDSPQHGLRREATPPQVVVTRSGPGGRSRGSGGHGAKRWKEKEVDSQRPQSKPFDTSLDMDFLSLFAS